MREAFQSELETIVQDLTEMCQRVRDAVREASDALLEDDLALAERVIAGDAHIDEMQSRIDEQAVDLLARQSPVATDLRVIVASLRMSSSLERMGDLAEHVALVVRRRHPDSVLTENQRDRFRQMADLAVQSIVDAETVIRERDLALAAKVEESDNELDDLMQEVYAKVAESDGELTTAQVVDLTLLGRFYERIGDHSVSLVRRVGFLVTGGSLDPRSDATDVDDF